MTNKEIAEQIPIEECRVLETIWNETAHMPYQKVVELLEHVLTLYKDCNQIIAPAILKMYRKF